MGRIYEFLPSVLIIACIAGITNIYLRLTYKHFGDRIKSVEWLEKNRLKVGLWIGTPTLIIWAPTAEELSFRAPLIIYFSGISSAAWYGIFVSGGLFALMHWFGNKISTPEIFSARAKNDHKSDDLVAELKRIQEKETGREILSRRILSFIFTLFCGLIAGYYGIKYQSIWVSVGIHFAWNLIMPTLITVLYYLSLLLLIFVVSSATFIWDKIRFHKRKRKRRFGIG